MKLVLQKRLEELVKSKGTIEATEAALRMPNDSIKQFFDRNPCDMSIRKILALTNQRYIPILLTRQDGTLVGIEKSVFPQDISQVEQKIRDGFNLHDVETLSGLLLCSSLELRAREEEFDINYFVDPSQVVVTSKEVFFPPYLAKKLNPSRWQKDVGLFLDRYGGSIEKTANRIGLNRTAMYRPLKDGNVKLMSLLKSKDKGLVPVQISTSSGELIQINSAEDLANSIRDVANEQGVSLNYVSRRSGVAQSQFYDNLLKASGKGTTRHIEAIFSAFGYSVQYYVPKS